MNNPLELKQKLKNFTNGKKYVFELLKNQKINIPFHNAEIELILQYHPDNIKKNVENIEFLMIQNRPPFYDRALYIKTKNNEEIDDISYVLCLRRLFGLRDLNYQSFGFLQASRDTIYNSKRMEFKKMQQECDIGCNICFSTQRLCIDHFNVSFKQILDEFIKNENVECQKVETVLNIKNNMFEFVDKDYESKWINFHDSRAVFRSLCRSCNSKEGSYGYRPMKIRK